MESKIEKDIKDFELEKVTIKEENKIIFNYDKEYWKKKFSWTFNNI